MNHYTPDGRDLRAELAPYLHPDETLLWTGQPYTTRKFRPHPLAAVFILFWFGFAIFWTVMASAAAGFFGLFGIPFLLIGVYLVYMLFSGQKKQFKSTVYAVTDRRAIILYTDRRGVNCTEHLFAHLTTVTMEEVQGTTGTIRFRPDMVYHNGYDPYEGYRGYRRRGVSSTLISRGSCFYAIDRVQEVFRLISEQIHT